MVSNNRKGISPVVATALLLVVAAVAVVGFQTWFNSYNSANMAKVESQSDSGASMSIERLEYAASGNGTVYIKNTGTADIAGVTMKVGGSNCNLNNSASGITIGSGLTELVYNSSACTIEKGISTEVILQTATSLQTLTVIPK